MLPRPARLVSTGIASSSASARSSRRTRRRRPCPRRRSISGRVGAGQRVGGCGDPVLVRRRPRRARRPGTYGARGTSASTRSRGMSTSTGPGLPLRAIANAWRRTSTIRSARSTRTDHFVTGAKMRSVATSCAAPRCAFAVAPRPAMTTIGSAADVRLGDPREEVRAAGPRGDEAHAGLARQLRVRGRHARRRLLVANEDVRDLGRVVERVVDARERARREGRRRSARPPPSGGRRSHALPVTLVRGLGSCASASPGVGVRRAPARSPAEQVRRVEQLGLVLELSAPCPGSGSGRLRARRRSARAPSATWANCSIRRTPTPRARRPPRAPVQGA